MFKFSRKKSYPFVTQLQDAELWKRYTKAELIEDLNYMVNTNEEVHPNLYFSFSKEKAAQHLDKVRTQLKDGISRTEFYTRIAPFTANFNDGHTMINIPHEEYVKSDHFGSVRFPLKVKCSPVEMTITGSILEEFDNLSGRRICKINHEPVSHLMTEMTSMLSGENLHFKYGHTSSEFSKLLFLLRDGSEKYLLELVGDSGPEEVVVPGINRADSMNDKTRTNPILAESYTIDIHADNSCAVLTLLRCEDETKFKAFIQKVFENLAKDRVNNLIIDLRHNGGGSSSIGDELCAYLTNQPICQFTGMKMKISEKIKKMYAGRYRKTAIFPKNMIPVSFLWAPLRMSSGSIFSMSVDKVIPLERSPLFDGKVFVITSHITFSAASSLAAMIKENGLGKLIGEPTGGCSSCYGDVFSYTLPNTKLLCGVSHKFFIGPDGNNEPAPISPDYHAKDFGIDLHGVKAITDIVNSIDKFV
ncbi:MAG: hypothetical protein K8S15_08905 [Candidatus Aegiribacteria sp.]|nr:hypothetical protein [Candidatus Aegiribacteria sp.]